MEQVQADSGWWRCIRVPARRNRLSGSLTTRPSGAVAGAAAMGTGLPGTNWSLLLPPPAFPC